MGLTDFIYPFSSAKCRGLGCAFWSEPESCVLAETPFSAMEIEEKLDRTNSKLDSITEALDLIAKQLTDR